MTRNYDGTILTHLEISKLDQAAFEYHKKSLHRHRFHRKKICMLFFFPNIQKVWRLKGCMYQPYPWEHYMYSLRTVLCMIGNLLESTDLRHAKKFLKPNWVTISFQFFWFNPRNLGWRAQGNIMSTSWLGYWCAW